MAGAVLRVHVDFQHSSGALSEVSLQHYEVVEGTNLASYMVVQMIVLISIAIMIFDIVVTVKYLIISWMEKDFNIMEHASDIFKQLVDISIAVMIVVYIIIRIPHQLSSAKDTREIVGGLAEIPWSDPSISADAKTTEFFGFVSDLLKLIDNEKALNSFCNVVLMLSLLVRPRPPLLDVSRVQRGCANI